MHSTLLLLPLLPLLPLLLSPLTHATPTPLTTLLSSPGTYHHTCETTHASPLSPDIHALSTSLKLRTDDNCAQLNPGGSKCTSLETYGTADAGICGDWSYTLKCPVVGRLVEELEERCRFRFPDGSVRAGGLVWWEGYNVRVILYHA